MGRIINPLVEMGAKIESLKGKLPISLSSAKLQTKFTYELPVASAQVKSSILLAGLAAKAEIHVIEPIQTCLLYTSDAADE